MITGILTLISGVLFATSLSTIFTKAVAIVDSSLIPKGTNLVASIDFAASPLSWIVYQLTANAGVIGACVLGIVTIASAIYNRKKNNEELA